MHPRIQNRRKNNSMMPAITGSYARARASMEELERLIDNLSQIAGLEAMAAYTAGLRELRETLDRAAGGDPHAVICLSSIPHAVSGFYLGMKHMVTVQAEASACHE